MEDDPRSESPDAAGWNPAASSETPIAGWPDARLLRRLMSWQVRPGLVDLTQADAIVPVSEHGRHALADRQPILV
jgi:hypothetical protein